MGTTMYQTNESLTVKCCDIDTKRQVETYDALQAHRKKHGLCFRCGYPERVNRWHCQQCHEDTSD